MTTIDDFRYLGSIKSARTKVDDSLGNSYRSELLKIQSNNARCTNLNNYK